MRGDLCGGLAVDLAAQGYHAFGDFDFDFDGQWVYPEQRAQHAFDDLVAHLVVVAQVHLEQVAAGHDADEAAHLVEYGEALDVFFFHAFGCDYQGDCGLDGDGGGGHQVTGGGGVCFGAVGFLGTHSKNRKSVS